MSQRPPIPSPGQALQQALEDHQAAAEHLLGWSLKPSHLEWLAERIPPLDLFPHGIHRQLAKIVCDCSKDGRDVVDALAATGKQAMQKMADAMTEAARFSPRAGPDLLSGLRTAEARARRWRAQVDGDDAALLQALRDLQDADSGAQKASQFEFLSMAELLQPNPVDWIIRDILDRPALASLFGDPGTYKSFVAIDMSVAIASGLDWHGHAVPNSGPVFFLIGEGQAGIRKRLKARTIELENAETLPIFVSKVPMAGTDPANVEAVAEAIEALARKHGSPVLVVVDTLNRNFGPGDENSTKDMTLFVQGLDQIKARLGCTVLVVHHTGHSEKERGRGASSFKGALDFEYRLTCNGDTLTFASAKPPKDYARPPEKHFKPETVDLPWLDEDGKPLDSCILRLVDAPEKPMKKLTGATDRAYKSLIARVNRRHDKDGRLDLNSARVPIEEWREQAYSDGITASTEKAAKQVAFRRAVSRLLDLEMVHTKDGYYWIKE